jgi:shikimate dehydrogenase
MELELYGLIGKKLSHSFSRAHFQEKFARESYPADYRLFEISSIGQVPELIRRNPRLRGLNVTIPYKTEVLPFLAELSPEAAAVGAVNTIKIEGDRWSGHNSDVYGFRLSLERFLGNKNPAGALILGSGGAAKAVQYVLDQMNCPYRIVSRTPVGAQQLAYEQLAELDWQAFPLIINTTPLGMYPQIEAAPPLPYSCLSAQTYAYDLIYNPAETSFMQQAAAQGAKTCNGLEMLVLQAERSWEIWQTSEAEKGK